MRATGALVAVVALVAAGGACAAPGAEAGFVLSGSDNDRAALTHALAAADRPAVARTPMAFLSADDPPRLVGWDLAAGKSAWTAEIRASSRVVAGGDFVVLRADKALVALDRADGHSLWKHQLPETSQLLGLAADGERIVYAVAETDRSTHATVWRVIALGRDGHELWRTLAPSQIGAPAVRGGVVFVPFLNQWLNLLDAASGKLLTRVRVSNEGVSWVRTTGTGVFYGTSGIFALDAESATGTPAGSHYIYPRTNGFPLVSAWFPGYDPNQLVSSGLDRLRMLWSAHDGAAGIELDGGQVVLFGYRFFFAVDAVTGVVKWVAGHPRTDIAAAEDDGAALVYVSVDGAVGALDPADGALLGESAAGVRTIGATFDAEGWRPPVSGAPVLPPPVVTSLGAIVTDRDARFTTLKMFAVESLGHLAGPEATAALVHIIADADVAREVAAKAGAVLYLRPDPTGLAPIVDELSRHADWATGATAPRVDILAHAASALADPQVVPLLIAQLDDPATPLPALPALADAIAASGARDVAPELASFLLLHRCDPTFAGHPAAAAVVRALLALGGPAGRETVTFVAHDPRTETALAHVALTALKKGAAP